ISVTPIPYGKDNYAYALHHAATRSAVLIDAGDATSILAWCKANNVDKVTHVLSTHKHHDHTGGNHALVRAWPACVVVGGQGEGVACVTREVLGGQVLPGLLDGHVGVEVVAAPGHTRGSVMYLVTCADTSVLFSGDTIFRAGVGKFFERGARDVLAVMDDLHARKLPEHTWLFSGHEYALANLQFAAQVMPDNAHVREELARVSELRGRGDGGESKCTVPTRLASEWQVNPFFRTRCE
ncbi:beta-lactamase-like protein, partial [Catenaria anguillulae PL171]